MQAENEQRAKDIVRELTLAEKAALVSGADYWHTEAVERLGLPCAVLSDGPHGLRRENDSAAGVAMRASLPATCFPTAAGLACSFDTALVQEVGTALGEEAAQVGVAVLLGPGLNIKRSPLCGRNFEYFSEDPLCAGELAAAMVRGIQSTGVSACPKHFALNNCENSRFISNSVCDERALKEIYLDGFRRVVQSAAPRCLMTSYNIVNGEYAGQSEQLLMHTLRCEWGFDGAVVSDWGACSDRVRGISAGADLEMPGKCSGNTQVLLTALEEGRLYEWQLDECCERVIRLVLDSLAVPRPQPDAEMFRRHHELARRAAARSAVLLKNSDNLLPLDAQASVAIIGRLAEQPRYQGSGSSKVNPVQLDTMLEELRARGLEWSYSPGYNADGTTNDALIDAARETARGAQAVVLVLGLPECCESEGFDRDHLRLPEGMLRLCAAVCADGCRVAVLLQLGAPVELPFIDDVSALLCCYLGGEAAGSAAVDILTGRCDPVGRLAESWPKKAEDVPCAAWYNKRRRTAEYREGIWVGYRYYDAVGVEPLFAFGSGLGYTEFTLSDLKVKSAGKSLQVLLKVGNGGGRVGEQTVFIYHLARPGLPKKLLAFKKVRLMPFEQADIALDIPLASLAYYNTETAQFTVLGGEYTLAAEASAATLCEKVTVAGSDAPVPAYIEPNVGMSVSDEQFYALAGGRPQEPPARPFTLESSCGELRHTLVGKLFWNFLSNYDMGSGDAESVAMMRRSLEDLPLRALCALSRGALSRRRALGIAELADGRLLRGIADLAGREREPSGANKSRGKKGRGSHFGKKQ